MNPPDRLVPATLPDPVLRALADFEEALDLRVRLMIPPPEPGTAAEILYATEELPGQDGRGVQARAGVSSRDTALLELEVLDSPRAPAGAVAALLARILERAYEAAREMRFFTQELSDRYEEIHLLYSISETLGSILHMDDAARVILQEVCDVMGALRGSLWIYHEEDQQLHLSAAVGDDGLDSPLTPDDPDTITSMVFREQKSYIVSRAARPEQKERGRKGDSVLAVPIRYTPPSGQPRTLGVLNLIGRKGDEKYSAADQKLLSAIASQVGSALENKRLHDESLSKERMGREMELAQDLQQKLLPAAERFEGAEAAARVVPAEQVGGDFYQLFRLPEGRIGVMLGDVSLHGFPSALIMTLTLSAAGIYAREHRSPAEVLRSLDRALRDELETTEMFLTVFYGVLDPAAGTLVYSNAGHPHAFVIHGNGGLDRLAATDPPLGFAGPESYAEAEVPWDREKDLLLLFTDGLSDTLAAAARRDGEERVLDTVISLRHAPVRLIVDELFALTVDAHPPIQGDDRTALVVRTP
jgi:phosphoserine phosphatase RsbU/P